MPAPWVFPWRDLGFVSVHSKQSQGLGTRVGGRGQLSGAGFLSGDQTGLCPQSYLTSLRPVISVKSEPHANVLDAFV